MKIKADLMHSFLRFYNRLFSLILYLLIISYTSSAGYAETLEEAWETALSSNNTLLATSEVTKSASSDVKVAKSTRLPKITLESGYLALDDSQAIKAELFGANAIVSTVQKDSHSYGANVSLPIYTGGSISHSIEASKFILSASIYNEIKTKQSIKLKVANAYVNVLRTQKSLLVAQSYVTSLESHSKDVNDLYNKGFAVNSDILSIEVALADANTKLLQAENALEISKSALNQLLSRELNTPINIEEVSPIHDSHNWNELMLIALEKRSELSIIKSQKESAKHMKKAIQGERLPQVGISGGYSYQENEFQKNEEQWYAAISCKWNLFDGGSITHREESTYHKQSALQYEYDETSSLIKLQVRHAYLNSKEAYKRILVTKKAIDQAIENLNIVRDRYKNGLSTHTEYLDAEVLCLSSKTNHANAIYDAVISDLEIKWACGIL